MPVTVTEIWRYPVKSMGGERLDNVAVDERGMVADRMWAVRDPELGSITTARRRPALLRCGARYAADPLGSAPEVVIVLPDGEEISSADPAVHARLSELVGSEVRLEPIPPPSDKDAYRAPRETKADIRAHFGLGSHAGPGEAVHLLHVGVHQPHVGIGAAQAGRQQPRGEGVAGAGGVHDLRGLGVHAHELPAVGPERAPLAERHDHL